LEIHSNAYALHRSAGPVQAYEHAAALIAKFGEVELTVKLLMQARLVTAL
jgi:hypothetical protein